MSICAYNQCILNKKTDHTIAMKLLYASGSSLNAAISSGKCGCIFWMRLKFLTSISSTLEPILSEDINMKWFQVLTAHLLGNAAHIAAFMSKKGLMEHRTHCAMCWKASTALVDLVIVRPGMQWPAATYLSSSWSCECILLRKVTISVQAVGGMVVVRRKERISSWCIQVDTSDPDTWLAASELCKKKNKGPTLLLAEATTMCRLLYLIFFFFLLYTMTKCIGCKREFNKHFLFLIDFLSHTTTWSSWTSYLNLPCGMPLQSSVFTPNWLSTLSKPWPLNWVQHFDNSNQQFVKNLWHKNYQVRKRLKDDAVWQKQSWNCRNLQREMSLKHQCKRIPPCSGSICHATNCIHSATTWRQSSC